MSYILNRTDGTILTELVDGSLDTDTTDISLVGRNYTGYGEFINENFIKILENFANSTVPLSPMRGQLWYDTSINKLKIYDGDIFTPASGSFVGLEPPNGPIAGDTWFDTTVNQLFLFDGDEYQLVGPQYTLQQGSSGISVRTVQDANLNPRTVLELRIGSTLQAVVSQFTIVPANIQGNIIPELVTTNNPSGTIFPGFNVVNTYDFVYQGTATRAQNLIIGKDTNTEFSTDKVLRNDQDGLVFGDLTLRGNVDSGTDPELFLGNQESSIARKPVVVNGITTNFELVLENSVVGNDVRVIVARNVNGSNTPTDAITVRAQDRFVGVFNANPSFTLDVDGDTRISGNLTVEGSTTAVESTTLTVADKNIELAVVDTPDNTTANGGGITLKGTTDKTLNWVNSSSSWTSSEHVDLATTKEYRINNAMVLDFESLGTGIEFAPSVRQLGTLDYVDINTIRIGATAGAIDPANNPSPVITRTGGQTGLTIDVAQGDISVQNSKITLVDTPTTGGDATNKEYVDREIDKSLLVFSMDITGWAPVNVNTNILLYLEQVFASSTVYNDKEAKVITTQITSETIDGIDVFSNTTVESAQVLVGPEPLTDINQITRLQVVEDITLPSNLSVPYIPTIIRQTRHYKIINGAWAAFNNYDGNTTNIIPLVGTPV